MPRWRLPAGLELGGSLQGMRSECDGIWECRGGAVCAFYLDSFLETHHEAMIMIYVNTFTLCRRFEPVLEVGVT